MTKTVIIAAAGSGSRLGMALPKCLVQVGNRAIFEYQLKAFGTFDHIIMVVGYKAEDVIAAVSSVRKDIIFIRNNDYMETTTLQSMYLGSRGVTGKAVFIDGDMILSRRTAEKIHGCCEVGADFIGVSTDLSEEPVYAEVVDKKVIWFDYGRVTGYEWANLAFLDTAKLEYNKTHFFVQLGKFLPTEALLIERYEVDTRGDHDLAETALKECPEQYDFWRK